MDRNKKNLIYDMILYGIGDFGSKLITFLLVPFYTRYLTTEQYGTMDLINTTQSLLIPILCLQIISGVYRYLVDSDKYDSNEIISTSMFFIGATSFMGLSVFLIFYKVFEIEIPYIGIILAMFILTMLNNMLKQIIRGLDQIKLFSISGILTTLFTCALNIYFIGFRGMSYLGMLWANVLTLLVINIIIIYISKLYKSISYKKINKSVLKELLIYSIPLLPNTVNWWVMNVSDRYILTAFLGMSAVGIYSLSNKIASIMFMVNSIFEKAWQTNAIQNFNSPNRDIYFSSIFNKLVKIQIGMILLATIGLKLVVNFVVGPEYIECWKYANILFLANMFLSFGLFYGVGYNCAKDTKSAFSTTIISSVINIVINIIFVKFLGIYAAAISTLISYMVLWVLRIFTTKRFFEISVDYKEMIKGVGLIILSNIINFTVGGFKLVIIDFIFLIIIYYVYRKDIKYLLEKSLYIVKKLNAKYRTKSI